MVLQQQRQTDNVIEMVKENGKTYAVVGNDFDKLRRLSANAPRGAAHQNQASPRTDIPAGRAVATVTVDPPTAQEEVRDRYYALISSLTGGFVNPRQVVEKDSGRYVVSSTLISYPANYVEQMLGPFCERDYSFLPNVN